MSLRVWLPMNRDLRNQGLDDVTVTNNGATFNSAGKLGGCYEFASGKRIQTTLPSTSNLNSKAISFACWVNISSWNSSYDCLMSIADGTGWQQSRATLCRNNTASTLCWNIADGNTSTRVYTTTSLSTNTWYHIACTYDGASLKIYVNGTLNNSTAATLSIGYAGTFNIGGWSGNNYPINCKMNDVRVYSHCLSPMEVKKLSQGLILHYPLNRQGWGQENLVTNSSSEWSSWITPTVNGTNQCSNPGVAVLPDDKVSTDKFACQVEIEFSGVTIGTGGTCAFRAQGAVDNGWSNGTNPWTKVFFSGTVPSDGIYKYTWIGSLNNTSVTHTNFNCGFRADYWGSGKYRVRCIKVEKGSVITPWCPHSNQTIYTTLGLNGTTEYDCSGFCNNGTRTGTFTWTSDTPKYAVSTKFDTTSSKIQLPTMDFSGMANSYTFAWWQYNVSTGNMPWGFSNGNRLNCYHCSPLCWNTGDGSSNQFKNGSSTVAPTEVQNGWHHMVVTGDSTSTKLYIDGVYRGTATTYKALTGTQIWISGWDSGTSYTFNGSKESDFRIYATALSTEDVKSLYQNCATIDPDGTIRGQIRS